MIKYLVFLVVTKALSRLPRRAGYAIADFVAALGYLGRGQERRNVKANLRQVMGPQVSEKEISRTARRIFRNVMRYYADLALLPSMDIQRFYNDEVTLHGLENLVEPLRAGRGVVVGTAHYGTPELVIQVLAALDVPILIITESLEPPSMSKLVHRLRASHGQEYRPVGFSTMKEALRRLRKGGAVGIIFDRDIQGTGRPLPFFGREAILPVGAVDLALRTGALLITAFAVRHDVHRFEGWIEPALPLTVTGDEERDLRENTLLLLARLEGYLRRDPGHWAVTEPVWPEGQD
jgi:KDO2-lipid IV(A) lauroyltransferase